MESPMADNGTKLFIHYNRTRARLRGMSNLQKSVRSTNERKLLNGWIPTDDIHQVSKKENNLLTAPYSEEEVRKAVFLMEHNKAPGPDGFPAEFYQKFWEVIKPDLLLLFSDLHAGQLELFHLNLVRLFYYPRLMRLKGYNNIDLFASLMLVLKYSRRLRLLG